MPSGIQNWSQTAATNATADSAINWAEGMPPSAVNDSARGMMAVLAKHNNDTAGTLTTAGTSTAYTLATNTVFTTLALLSGQTLTVKFNAANGASPTLNVDGLGAKAIQTAVGTAIGAGALLADSIHRMTYDNSNSAFILHDWIPLQITTQTAETAPAVADEIAIYDASASANRKMTLANVLKVINDLTADASPVSSTDYVVTYDASASAAKKVLLQNLPSRLPRGYIDGCILSNGTDATNDINFAAGVCRDSTNAVDITCAAMAGKQLDANWAPGAAAGMRNSAAGIADTTYHLYAVAKADGTQDYYAHTSATVATVITALQAETGGTDYLYARHIGSIIRSTAILGFTQIGDHFRWKVGINDRNAVAPASTSAVTNTLTVPTGIAVIADFSIFFTPGSNNFYALVTALDETDTTPAATAFTFKVFGSATDGVGGDLLRKTNTSGQIRTRMSVSGASDTLSVYTNGFIHPRGKDA